MNVAFHARNLGLDASLVSRVGRDALGDELLAFLSNKKVPLRLVQRDTQQPTSTVQVKLDKAGHASYEIVAPVAWDLSNGKRKRCQPSGCRRLLSLAAWPPGALPPAER